MSMLLKHIKWIMLISGILTCSMALAIVAPRLAMQRAFGVALEGSLADVLVRSWGVLVTLIGVMLIYAAFRSIHRNLVLSVAIVSKAALIALILGTGKELLPAAAPVIVIDALMVMAFSLILLLGRQSIHDVSP